MVTPRELNDIGIHQWDEGFGEHFEGSDIFIGNGFSINLCERLNYRMLLEIFNQRASKPIRKIFEALDTSNFEYVMDALKLSKIVTNLLGTKIDNIDKLIEEIKVGLINSIQTTHPSYRETNFPLMESLAKQFTQFKDVYTTNYDIFLYRIILATNELIETGRIEAISFQDDFYETISPTQLGFGGSFDPNLRKIYYLHGSLFFYRMHIQTYKLRRIDEVEYINLIRREISNNNFPVFVAEGTSHDKQLAISNNSYLTYCSDHLKKKRNSKDTKLTVYGFSFSNPDNHLVNMINTSGIREMAVSLWPGMSIENLEREKSRINALFGNVQVTFYDSRSIFNFKLDYVGYGYLNPKPVQP